MLNGILCVYEPLNLSLAEESATFVDEVINLAENASQYRPLGSSSMPLCLVAALAATDDVMKQERLDKLLAEYQTDFASARWLDMAFLLRAKMGNPRLDISAAYREGKTCTTVIATEEMALSNRCITE
jgi:hypothetical protein